MNFHFLNRKFDNGHDMGAKGAVNNKVTGNTLEMFPVSFPVISAIKMFPFKASMMPSMMKGVQNT